MEPPRLDPRLHALRRRLEKVKKRVAVLSPKGGVGKTTIAALTALLLSRRGLAVGLFDADVTNLSLHTVLGVDVRKLRPTEEKGVVPPSVAGVKFMSLAFYVGDEPLPLRGPSISEAVRELLSITNWGELDVLIIDTPPGLSDEVLELLLIVPELEALVVSTSSTLSLKSVEKLLKLLKELRVKILGLVENMAQRPSPHALELCRRHEVRYLTPVPFDPELEERMGSPDALLQTAAARSLALLADILAG